MLKPKIECLQTEEGIPVSQNKMFISIKASSNHWITRTLKIMKVAIRIIPQYMKVTRILYMSVVTHFCSTLSQNGFQTMTLKKMKRTVVSSIGQQNYQIVCLFCLRLHSHAKCIILHIGTNDLKNSSGDDLLHNREHYHKLSDPKL